MKLISIVVPCYNELDNVIELYERVEEIMQLLPQYRYELIYIDNASTDGTEAQLRELAARDRRVKVILNSRNFGHIRSPFHALMQAGGDAVISLAADLQDPPELLPEFLKRWEQGNQIVVGVKEKSKESPLFFLIRRLYYWLVGRLSDIPLLQNCTGFGLYDRRIIDILKTSNDPYPYFRGMIAEVGFRLARIPYTQPLRKRSITKNNFYTLYDLAMLGITNYSKIPLRLAAMLGFAMSFFSLLTGLGYLAYKLMFWSEFKAGIAPVVVGLFLISSVQLFFIGVIGEYIGSIHTKVTNRSLVIERERINFDEVNVANHDLSVVSLAELACK
jgi:glycosyltransferase involved in cell wall biosynthesis